MDVDEADLLAYLRDDDHTRVIGMYIEGADHGIALMREASETSYRKPIIALKAGRTSSGARAASSHTGALSGSDKVYDAAMEQSGMIRVRTIDELFDLLQVFNNMPLPKGDGLAIITNAGGLGVLAADAVSDHGMTLSSFKKETVTRLRERLPPEANFYNPVDVIGDADAARYEFAIRTVMEDENVSAVLAMVAPTDILDISSVARAIASLASNARIPIVTAFVGGHDVAEGSRILLESGVPNYGSPDRAVGALGSMVRYREMRDSRTNGDVISIKGDMARARTVLDKVKAEGRTLLDETEGKEILRAYGVYVPPEGDVRTADEAISLARSIGHPVVMKISSPDIAHKTDVGGIAVDLRSDEDVRKAYEQMIARVRTRMPSAHIDGVTIEKMVFGREVIVGMVRDPQFGPVITFGLGGIFVEIMKDVTQKIAPLTDHDVGTMIRSIKAYPILTGARGRRPADISALKNIIFSVAQIAIDLPEISEFEINPVILGDEGQGASAVDALATIRREK